MSGQERELMAAICDAYEKRYPRDMNPMLDTKFEAGYRAALAAREERNLDGKIQMYNLAGEYPDLPSRLLEWPDYCTEVDRADKAEQRVAELEADVREEPQKGAIVDELIGAGREDTERPESEQERLAHLRCRCGTAIAVDCPEHGGGI
jgi:hypothetical protein